MDGIDEKRSLDGFPLSKSAVKRSEWLLKSTLLVEENVKPESNWKIWYLVLNTAAEAEDSHRGKCECWKQIYWGASNLSCRYCNHVNCREVWTSIKDLLPWIKALGKLKMELKDITNPPKTECWILLSGRACLLQTGPNDYKYRKKVRPGY